MIKIEILDKQKYSTDIFDLRNRYYVKKNSINNEKIKKQNHKIWFQKCLKENKIYIIKSKDIFVGYIRIKKKTKMFHGQ